jgi:integrase
MRVPSELHALDVEAFDQDTHELEIYEAKTGRTRTLQLEPWLAEIFTNWIEGPRDEIAKRKTRQLIPHPGTGEPWKRDALRMFLWRHGRNVDDAFSCYGMRRWGLVWRCLQWQMNVLRVKDWAGHEAITSTMYYLRIAEAEMRRRVHAHEVQPLELAAISI